MNSTELLTIINSELPNGFATFTGTNISAQPRTRQELYDHIRQMGTEEFILEEMIRYGFWPLRDLLTV